MNTILLIDDNATYQASLLEALNLETCQSLDAENDLIGLDLIQLFTPNLLVSAVNLPSISGLKVLQKVAANPMSTKIPFLTLMEQSDMPALNISQNFGLETQFTKPLGMSDFLTSLFLRLKLSPTIIESIDE